MSQQLQQQQQISQQNRPLVECFYGWGQKALLYHDRLEVPGSTYFLSDLMYVEPLSLSHMGITSIRLKLFFKHKMVLLRGLADSAVVQKMVTYLSELICSPLDATMRFPALPRTVQQTPPSTHPPFWNYSQEETIATSPSHTISQPVKAPYQTPFVQLASGNHLTEDDLAELMSEPTATGITATHDFTTSIKPLSPSLTAAAGSEPIEPTNADLLALYGQFVLPDLVYLPEYIQHLHRSSLPEKKKATQPTGSLPSTPITSTSCAFADAQSSVPEPLRAELRRQHLLQNQIQREIGIFGFSVDGLLSQLQQDQLPTIEVPLRLLPGEIAHYRTDATLCEEPAEAISYEESRLDAPFQYRIKDRGSCILTNYRLFYLGRKRHMILRYEQILHIAQWHDFITITVRNFQHRQLFEMRRPLECLLYLEYLLKYFYASSSSSARNNTSPVSPVPPSGGEQQSIIDADPLLTRNSIRLRALARMNNPPS